MNIHAGLSVQGNSAGFVGFNSGTRYDQSCVLVAGDGENMQRDYWYDSRRCFDDLEAAQVTGAEAARRTVRPEERPLPLSRRAEPTACGVAVEKKRGKERAGVRRRRRRFRSRRRREGEDNKKKKRALRPSSTAFDRRSRPRDGAVERRSSELREIRLATRAEGGGRERRASVPRARTP